MSSFVPLFRPIPGTPTTNRQAGGRDYRVITLRPGSRGHRQAFHRPQSVRRRTGRPHRAGARGPDPPPRAHGPPIEPVARRTTRGVRNRPMAHVGLGSDHGRAARQAGGPRPVAEVAARGGRPAHRGGAAGQAAHRARLGRPPPLLGRRGGWHGETEHRGMPYTELEADEWEPCRADGEIQTFRDYRQRMSVAEVSCCEVLATPARPVTRRRSDPWSGGGESVRHGGRSAPVREADHFLHEDPSSSAYPTRG